MKDIAGVWLPDAEEHLVSFLHNREYWIDGRGSYQYHKLLRALVHMGDDWRVAVDVGAHVGLWSMQLVKRFATVEAYEPLAAHRACFARNVPVANATLHPIALGAGDGMAAMVTTPSSSGDSWIVPGVAGGVRVMALDEFRLEAVDFIKLDCEGYELFALQGAVDTLRRCRPVVIVEQKPGRAQKYGLGETDAVAYLEGLGATLRDVLSGDFILSWD